MKAISVIENFTPDRTANSFYNTGCIDEINKIIEQCSKFKVHVTEVMMTRFKTAVIILCILIIIRFFLEYGNFQWKYLDGSNETINSRAYTFIIGRLNWVIVILAIITLALFFI